MLACDFGQSTECMCEMLWVCCNGEDVEDYCPHEIFQFLAQVGEIKEQDKGTEAINTLPPS